jgi:YVTN family beta-propeller protein
METGAVLAGYRIEHEIGRGGMGVVYLAVQERLNRRVALKVISPDQAGDPGFRRRFERESRVAATIEHPHAVALYEAGETEEGTVYLVMRFVDGTDLRALLAQEQWLDPDRAASVIAGVAGALDAAHRRGLVHRDVKPANVLIGEVGGQEWPYLTDFGLSKLTTGSSDLTDSGEWLGTLDYASPEQIQGKAVDARSDVYSLGCVLFETLTGRIPFERPDHVAKLYAHLNDPPPSLAEAAPDVPAAFTQVVERALAKDPKGRFPSAGDLGRAAVAAAGDEAVTEPERSVAKGEAAAPGTATATAITRRLKASRPRGRRGLLLGAFAAVALAAVAAAILLLAPSEKNGPEVVATLKVGSDPLAIDVGEGGIWVANSGDDTITRIDPATGRSDQPIRVGDRPAGVQAAAGSVWVTNSGSGTVSRLDPGTGRSRGEIPVGLRPAAIRVGLGFAWVANVDGGTVARIAPSRGSAGVQLIRVGSQPSGVAIGHNSVWVANSGDGTVSRIARTGEVVGDPIAVGNRPRGVAAGSEFVWVANALDGSVSRIEPFRSAVSGEPIAVGAMPAQVAVGAGAVWVANEGDDSVSRIDPASGGITDTIDVGAQPRGVVVGDGSVWVTNSGDGTVTRIRP